MGMTLFDRGGRQMVLTAADRRFLPPARPGRPRGHRRGRGRCAACRSCAKRITVAAPHTTLTHATTPFLAIWAPNAFASPYRQVTTRFQGVIGNDLGAHLASRLVTPSLRAWHFFQVAADGHVSPRSSTTLPSVGC
ncbi:hypothetical protein ABZZ79_19555 [Streptomyces sp. NPDC006458]|uniref:hypothetical protein n=1 Tax=Streptomyces sp. NPDC006458 TaxID=3154302 RepID=UPI0033AC2898